MGSLSKRKRPDRRKSDNVIQQFYKMPPKKRYSLESDHRANGSAHFRVDEQGLNGLDPLPQRNENEDALPRRAPIFGGTNLSALSSAESVNTANYKSVQISRKKGVNKKHRELMATSFSSSKSSESVKMRRNHKQKKFGPLFPSAIQTATVQRQRTAPMTAASESETNRDIARGPQFDENDRKIPTPFPGPLTMGNLQKHQNTMSLAGLRVSSSKTDDSEMEMDHVMAQGITPPPPQPTDDDHDLDDDVGHGIGGSSHSAVHSHHRNETYDAFLSGLGAEIRRQQQRESKLEDLNSEHGPPGHRHDDGPFTLRINSVDVDRIEDFKGHSLRFRSQSMPRRRRTVLSDHRMNTMNGNGHNVLHRGRPGPGPGPLPSGYLHALDLPATPPLSSCGGMMSDGSFSRSEQVEIDDIAVNEDTMRRNKLMSIHLMTNDGHQRHETKGGRGEHKETATLTSTSKPSVSSTPNVHQHRHRILDHDERAHRAPNSSDPTVPATAPMTKTKVGDVFFTKMLRMTFILNIAIECWSREWFINGMARALRSQDIRFRVHRERGIATEYSYISLLCRCDEYDMKQLKNTFEFTFISGEMEECIAESVGKPKLKIIIASCLSYKHYHCLYPKPFLRWITRSKPPANPISLKMESDDHQHDIGGAAQHRMGYHFNGMDKMSIINAEYIQLPFSHKQLMQSGIGNKSEMMPMEKTNDGMLTPPDRTILHFMSIAL